MTTNPSPPATRETFQDFPGDVHGTLLRPGDAGYDKARAVFNGRGTDEGPALIVQCADAGDVATVLRYASATRTPVAVRGGGHADDDYAMPGGALVVDLSKMRSVTVDPATRIVRAQPGVLLAELDAATQQHGLVVPAGTVSTTGLAGLTLGGGTGHLMRRFGATVDNLLGCEVVTLDGLHVRADEHTNADLFWALRGGGGNFGVVVSFEYRAHPVGPAVVSGPIIYPIEQAAGVLGALQAHMAAAPRELALVAVVAPLPPLPMVPPQAHGQPVLILFPVYSADPAAAGEVIASLAALGQPLVNLVETRSWVETNSMFDDSSPYGKRLATRGGYLASLGPEAITPLLDQMRVAPRHAGAECSALLWCLGGAISEDVPEDAVAFSRAGAAWVWEAVAIWDEPEQDREYDEWADRAVTLLRPYSLTNAYTNLTRDLGEQWRRGAFGAEAKYRRLQRIKAAWDPHNLFRYNKNITPLDEGEAVR
ncbi:MAG TPA: FAD-binding oxidoreductase [Rugosimonospora sp.]|nr:FAD-binding oxidoreductase [Rugosimonospora sp.]